MRINIILPAALTLALASATGAFAQSNKYDPTGDHMYSFGAATQASVAPTHTRAVRHVEENHAPQPQMQTQVQYDRTGDHMFSFGPASR